MHFCFRNILGAAGLVLLLAAFPALSSTIVYTDAPSWASATTGDTFISFNGLAPAGSVQDYSNSTGLVMNGVSFVGYYQSLSSFSLTVVDSGYISPYYNFGTGGSLRGPVNDRASTGAFLPYIQVNLPAGVTAFATDLMTASPNDVPFSVKLSDGETFTVNDTGARPATTFFGLTTDSSIAYVQFALPSSSINGGTFALLRDFEYGTANTGSQGTGDTPEACTMVLIGTGLVLFRYLQKRGFGLKPGPA